MCFYFFFLNDTATTEIYTLHIVGSVRCVQETGGINAEYMGGLTEKYENKGYTPRILNNGTVKRFVVTQAIIGFWPDITRNLVPRMYPQKSQIILNASKAINASPEVTKQQLQVEWSFLIPPSQASKKSPKSSKQAPAINKFFHSLLQQLSAFLSKQQPITITITETIRLSTRNLLYRQQRLSTMSPTVINNRTIGILRSTF
eukprot:TRINITY_DN12812_c0_g1_i2.p2 TRINITY_DN12812_c0_g1~~TRINITY_DN12812_c0_g1_i2.p2  ORF type:complete len:202 (+),score=26.35 TRINITY_DN12812_c0_g1_i2:96-701(+)